MRITSMRLAVMAGVTLALTVGLVRAERPLKDYSFIRGVNHGMYGEPAVLGRDLGYAKRVNLNSTRIWLSYRRYESNPEAYIERLRNYIRTSHRLGFSTMPILWNGNGLDPDTLKPEFRASGDGYVKAIVEAVKDEPGLLMWDIMNVPLTNPFISERARSTSPKWCGASREATRSKEFEGSRMASAEAHRDSTSMPRSAASF